MEKKLDPYDEFQSIDLELIDDVNEYKERIDECREWKDEHDSNHEYNIDPSQFDDEDEYVDALRKLWKRKYDYFNEFSSIDQVITYMSMLMVKQLIIRRIG